MLRYLASLFLMLMAQGAMAIGATTPQAAPTHTLAKGEPVLVSMTLEPISQVNAIALTQNYMPLMNYLGNTLGNPLRMIYSHDPTQELINTRISKYTLVIGPAHVVGSALRHGYEPVAAFPGQQKMLFVTLKSSGIRSLDQCKGKRLALPPPDSLATYMARGEFTIRGIKAKSYFSEIRYFSLHESALFSLGFGAADVAVVDAAYAQDWLTKQNGNGLVLLETQAVPFVSIAIDGRLPGDVKDKIRNALLKPTPEGIKALSVLNVQAIQPIAKDDYMYVSTLGYFTPTVLKGATLVTAEQARDLMGKGAILYDVRNERDWREKHIKGATWVHYEEQSKKDIEFDRALDKFPMEKLTPDKDAKVIFQCNGFECWKSYKAAVLALDAGYKNVYWFRGGFPEWNNKGFPVE
jgi:ABC-type phosphate/phosphonate transport system substrate-binding protein/rhodanese-related sulfurtransferase